MEVYIDPALKIKDACQTESEGLFLQDVGYSQYCNAVACSHVPLRHNLASCNIGTQHITAESWLGNVCMLANDHILCIIYQRIVTALTANMNTVLWFIVWYA